MKMWLIVILVACTLLISCEKNEMSKIPHITLKVFGPDSIRANYDTAYIQFSFSDGDADLANDTASSVYIKDMRFDSAGFIRYDFPAVDPNIEDPKKGLTGIGVVLLLSPPPVPRDDSFHLAVGDTTSFEMYITDRARNESNHITTGRLIIRI